jgi:hypothetical protein
MELEDVERIDRLVAEHDRIHSGFLTSYALHNPEVLQEEQANFRDRAGLTIPRDESIARAEQMMAELALVQQAKEAAKDGH